MAIALDIRFAPGEQERFLSLLNPKRYNWAMKEALNRTSGNVAQFAHKKVAKEMGLTQKQLYKRGRRTEGSTQLGTVSKGRNASLRRLQTSVRGFGRPFNVTRWNGRAIRGGVGGTITATYHEAWGTPRVLHNTWMLTKSSGNPIVVREGPSFRGVFGPGVVKTMEKPNILVPMQRFTNRRFRIHWRSRLRFAFQTRSLPEVRR